MVATPPISFGESPDTATLQRKLDSIFTDVRRKDVVVGYSVNGHTAFAGVSDGNDTNTSDRMLEVGCLVKLFMATLVEQSVEEGVLPRDGDLTSLLQLPHAARHLAGIRVSHLLHHTHGLDDSPKWVLLRSDGFIDADSLLARCTERRLNRPGEIYSYSNAGAWILAALLEQGYSAKYTDILGKKLFDPLGVRPNMEVGRHDLSTPAVCPAKGGALTISIAHMLRCLESVIVQDAYWQGASEPGATISLPGWHPFERGVYRGWKSYGDGWYGHSAIAEDQRSALVRVHPRLKVAVVIASVFHHANVVAAKLFGKAMPGFSSLKIPRRLSGRALGNADLNDYPGTYTSGTEMFRVVLSSGRQLRLVGPKYEANLAVAENDLCLPKDPEDSAMGFVQFVEKRDGRFCYLWNGQRLYRNERVPVERYDAELAIRAA